MGAEASSLARLKGGEAVHCVGSPSGFQSAENSRPELVVMVAHFQDARQIVGSSIQRSRKPHSLKLETPVKLGLE